MKVKVKKLHKNAVIPSYAKTGDAGMDLTAVSVNYDEHGNAVYGTGIAFEIPHGHVGLLFPRSSNSNKDLLLSNSVGVIDSGYRGEVMMKFKSTLSSFDLCFDKENNIKNKINYGKNIHFRNDVVVSEYKVGDRIGQLIIIPYPAIELEETDELSETERGTGGYGSTGK